MANLTSLLQNAKAFIWDFDGCVMDSEGTHHKTYSRAIKELFNIEIPAEEYFRIFTHEGNGPEKLEASQNLREGAAKEIRVLKNKYFDEELPNIKIFPETKEILKKMQANGAKVCIASNNVPEIIEKLLSQNGIENEFSFILGKIPELRSKPAPDLFLKAQEKLGIPHEQCIVFEDTKRGLMAANAANIPAVFIKNQNNMPLEPGADVIGSLTHQQLLESL